MTAFSTVAEFAWQDNGCLLAFTVDAEGIAGSGVHLSDPRTSLPWLLDSDEATFAGLAGREKDDDLACYRSGPDIDDEEDTQVVLAWRDLGSAGAAAATKAYYQAANQAFSADMRVVPFRRPRWAKDGCAREKRSQIDYHRRILQWFGHYLKGEDAPARITRGVTAIGSERASKTR